MESTDAESSKRAGDPPGAPVKVPPKKRIRTIQAPSPDVRNILTTQQIGSRHQVEVVAELVEKLKKACPDVFTEWKLYDGSETKNVTLVLKMRPGSSLSVQKFYNFDVGMRSNIRDCCVTANGKVRLELQMSTIHT